MQQTQSRQPDRETWLIALLPLLCFGIAAIVLWNRVGSDDFDQGAAMSAIAVWWYKLGHFGSTWNPFLCGGGSLVGNPQIPWMHISLPMIFVFGPVNGLWMMSIVWSGLGFWSMWRYSRLFFHDKKLCALLASSWVLNGFFVSHYGQMHFLFQALVLIPLFLYFARRIAHAGCKTLDLIELGFWTLVCGANNYAFFAYFFPFLVPYFFLELWTAKSSIREKVARSFWFVSTLFLVIGVLALYLLPALQAASEYPRTVEGNFENPFRYLVRALAPVGGGATFPAAEYKTFLGPVILWCAARSIYDRASRRFFWPLILLLTAAFIVATGSWQVAGLHLGPLDILKKWVPGFASVRVPSRYLIVTVPPLLILAGHWLSRRPLKRSILAWILVPFVLFFISTVLGHHVKYGTAAPTGTLQVQELTRFEMVPGSQTAMSPDILAGRGVMDCYDPFPVHNAFTHEKVPVALLDSDSEFEVQGQDPSSFWILRRPSTSQEHLVLNINHHHNWKMFEDQVTKVPTSVDGERLQFLIGPGTQKVQIRYQDLVWPRARLISFACLLSWFGLLGFHFVLTQRKRA